MAGEAPGRVLVVDDDRMTRMLIAGGVRREGHEVTAAADGREALALLRAEPFDAVLLDIVMPELDGFAVLAELKADAGLTSIPVIVVSAVEDMASVVKAIEMGAVDYLPKPFDAVLLRARLRTSLQQKRLRDLEQAYLRQELAIRQSEKLATLGRLSAGVAHELNNPAAAAIRSVSGLADNLDHLLRDTRALFAAGLDPEAIDWVREVVQRCADDTAPDALERADREDELGEWLERAGVDEAYELAAALVDQGFRIAAVQECTLRFREKQVAMALSWIAHRELTRSLAADVHRAVARISEIVVALKGYSYMDRGPEQLVDVHGGLDDTLLILSSKLRGTTVVRDYAPDLPRIAAFGPELNQVWTNLLDNAADVLAGRGELRIATRHADGWVEVAVTDDGPGVSADVLPRVFDPFVTTKPPGTGTGLGLNIAHQIVTGRHGGRIEVTSRPGATTFAVRLPVARAGKA